MWLISVLLMAWVIRHWMTSLKLPNTRSKHRNFTGELLNILSTSVHLEMPTTAGRPIHLEIMTYNNVPKTFPLDLIFSRWKAHKNAKIFWSKEQCKIWLKRYYFTTYLWNIKALFCWLERSLWLWLGEIILHILPVSKRI